MTWLRLTHFRGRKLRDGQRHGNISLRGVRIRADDMRFGDEIFDHGPIQSGNADRQSGFDPKTFTIIAWSDANVRRDRSVGGNLHVRFAGDKFKRSEEAGRVACCEELFRIGAGFAIAAEFFRGGERDGENSIDGRRFAFAAAGGCNLGAIKNVHEVGVFRIFVPQASSESS